MDMIPVIPGFFNIVHTENPGAAFGFLADSNLAWRRVLLLAVSVVVMSIIGSLLYRARQIRCSRNALALVFGGALGNAWDRLTRGFTA